MGQMFDGMPNLPAYPALIKTPFKEGCTMHSSSNSVVQDKRQVTVLPVIDRPKSS